MQGGGEGRALQAHKGEVGGCEGDHEPGEEVVAEGVLKEGVEGEGGEGGGAQGEEDVED